MSFRFLFMGIFLASAALAGAVLLSPQLSLNAASIRCLHLYGNARRECMAQERSTSSGLDQDERVKARIQRRQASVQAAPQSITVRDFGTTIPLITDADHLRGNRSAKITLIEYLDFECPFCSRHVPTINQVLSTYGDDVNLVVRHFPLAFHANAKKEAEAAECAARLGGNEGFWSYFNALFARTKSGGTGFPLDGLVPLAAELGLPQREFSDCLNGDQTAAIVDSQFAKGKDAGVAATPTVFIVNNAKNEAEKILGAVPVARFKTSIDAILK